MLNTLRMRSGLGYNIRMATQQKPRNGWGSAATEEISMLRDMQGTPLSPAPQKMVCEMTATELDAYKASIERDRAERSQWSKDVELPNLGGMYDMELGMRARRAAGTRHHGMRTGW